VKRKKISCNSLEHIERLTGDASTRKYYRVHCSNDSYVVCLDNPTELNKNLFVLNQGFFKENGIRVPQIYDKDVEKGYLLEEDLGDETLLKLLGIIKCPNQELEIYKRIIDEMIRMHQITEDKLKDTVISKHSFDKVKLGDEVEFSLKYFLRKFLNNDDEAIFNEINSTFQSIISDICKMPMVCTHRDFHSRNIMVKNGEYIIIDFQDARMGLPQYDLVSLLEDCYYDLTDENRETLKKYYFENMDMTALGQGSYEEFCRFYDLMLLQRVFKAIGSFSYIFEHRKDYRYVKYIGFAMEKIRKTMLKDERFNSLRRPLFNLYYES
jgi:aminoglycoside/choline kinase family phosphotransferase